MRLRRAKKKKKRLGKIHEPPVKLPSAGRLVLVKKLKGQTVPLSHSGGIVTDFNLTQILLLLFGGKFCVL